MANCPKCGRHLRLVDWKQKCPHCGANVFLYDLQERLMQDADKAEVQHFYFQKKVDRAKASYIGSKRAMEKCGMSFAGAEEGALEIGGETFTRLDYEYRAERTSGE